MQQPPEHTHAHTHTLGAGWCKQQPDSVPPSDYCSDANRRVICIFVHLTWPESSGVLADNVSSLSDHFINKKKKRKGARAQQVSGEGSAKSAPSGGGDKTRTSHTGPNLG